MDIIQTLIANMTLILAIIGAIAFLVSVITQVIKNISIFNAYMQYIHMTILWYMILAAIMAGFIVAFVAMFGWEKLSDLWKRFGKDVK